MLLDLTIIYLIPERYAVNFCIFYSFARLCRCILSVRRSSSFAKLCGKRVDVRTTVCASRLSWSLIRCGFSAYYKFVFVRHKFFYILRGYMPFSDMESSVKCKTKKNRVFVTVKHQRSPISCAAADALFL